MTRLDYAQPAVRPALKARLMLAAPPGGGKTRTGLLVGETLLAVDNPDFPDLPVDIRREAFLVIDTEKESALTYADDHAFTHLAWRAPYDPRELAEVLDQAGTRHQAVMIDSLSHFWRKAGGTLDIAEGKYSGWKVARPAQEDLIDAILGCKAHVILGVRSKVEYVQKRDGDNWKVEKLGMAPQQDDTLEYELNICAELDMEHRLTITKSRTTSVPVGRFFHAGHAAEFAQSYGEWLRAGEAPAPLVDVQVLVDRINAIPDDDARLAAKREFVTAVGLPENLPTSRLGVASELVAAWEARYTTTVEAVA